MRPLADPAPRPSVQGEQASVITRATALTMVPVCFRLAVDDESPGFSSGTLQLLMGFADGESPRFTLCMSENAQSISRLAL
ncbi:uncharacterized protein TrAtP1_013083 [Trichoderma atroviride]|uniref:uncharacterized protein n=1 Tax=Hypocrea atroviridis TaxID=63577 RepID=UPI0033231A73|nr:hypothetical protein TrAtP1_013083 [Trichoderma atroviride]